MSITNKFSETIWKQEAAKFKELEAQIKIPGRSLGKVDSVLLQKQDDIGKIPNVGGCYWIWTNEPVKHRFHRHRIPKKVRDGEIIYNGIAKDNIRIRIKRHLFGEVDAKWSGISLDIWQGDPTSHRKKAMATAPRAKVPYLDLQDKSCNYECIRDKNALLRLFLSQTENDYIRNSNDDSYYFRNGINVLDDKHKDYSFRVYYIAGLESLYAGFVEKKWREKFGLPRLCTYSSGR